MTIGFSTGCLYGFEMSMEDRIKFIAQSGADAIELGFAYRNELVGFRLNPAIKKLCMNFSFVTIHAPWLDIKYQGSAADAVIIRLKQLVRDLNADAVVVHPDVASAKYLVST
ncbi:MAG: hypothetical protein ABIG95_07130 [Candidatus Woesearchaeota archaeon]